MSGIDKVQYKCPDCGSGLSLKNDVLSCGSNHSFNIKGGIADLTASGISFPPVYEDPDYQKWTRIALELLLDSYKSGSWVERIQDYGHSFLESISDNDDNWRLDLGCGFGRHFDFIRDKKKVIGFDSNFDSLMIAGKNNPESIFVKGRMERLPFLDKYFAVIYAIYSLEHIYNLKESIKEIKRVLKKGGQLLIGLPAEGGFLYNGLRKMTTIPYFTKKYGIDYEKVVKIEHCNTATKVLKILESEFGIERVKYYPLGIKTVHANLILAASFRNG